VDGLRRCVRALFSVITDYQWELVIIDNGSQDDTGSFLSSLPKQFKNIKIATAFEAKPGLAAARNKGWRLATGCIVAFTDDDCYVCENYVDAMVSAFDVDPMLGVVGGRILLFDAEDLNLTILDREEYLYLPPRTFVPTGVVQGANMAFRRRALEQIGGFDEEFGAGTKFPAEDIDAVAAVLWSGMSGGYNPAPIVYHHHRRRKASEAEILLRNYDEGRGAYYAKYVLNRESRSVYSRAWMKSIVSDIYCAVRSVRSGKRPTIRRSFRELRSGVRYVLLRCCTKR
jgi:GT2 family glycosyltransferase